jgi:hypothetical protein
MLPEYCAKCGKQLIPAPARFDGEFTFVGFLEHDCNQQKEQAFLQVVEEMVNESVHAWNEGAKNQNF